MYDALVKCSIIDRFMPHLLSDESFRKQTLDVLEMIDTEFSNLQGTVYYESNSEIQDVYNRTKPVLEELHRSIDAFKA